MALNENPGCAPAGEPAPAVLEGRIWVDGCWDFFHHGSTLSLAIQNSMC